MDKPFRGLAGKNFGPFCSPLWILCVGCKKPFLVIRVCFVVVVVLERLKNCSRILYFSLIIVKSLQLCVCRQITEPRKYCLVCVIVFFFFFFLLTCVFSIFLFLTCWEFRVKFLTLLTINALSIIILLRPAKYNTIFEVAATLTLESATALLYKYPYVIVAATVFIMAMTLLKNFLCCNHQK